MRKYRILLIITVALVLLGQCAHVLLKNRRRKAEALLSILKRVN